MFWAYDIFVCTDLNPEEYDLSFNTKIGFHKIYLEHTRFPEDTKCMISGWGDVNNEENGIQGPDMLQVAFVKIFNFEVSTLTKVELNIHLIYENSY